MTDGELIARLRGPMPHMPSIKGAASILAAVARERKDAADRIEALVERAERLEAALREIADEAAVTVHTGKNGINYKKMYEGWRKIATDRIDIARAALKGADDE